MPEEIPGIFATRQQDIADREHDATVKTRKICNAEP
jgi:hypothetical protein